MSFSATGSSTNDTEAEASSAGAQEKASGGDGAKDGTNKDVNEKADANLGVANANDHGGFFNRMSRWFRK